MAQDDTPSKLRVAGSSPAAPTKFAVKSAAFPPLECSPRAQLGPPVQNYGPKTDRASHVDSRTTAAIAASIRQTLPPEFAYAFEKTGRLVTHFNAHLLADEELAEWDAAVEEYRRLHPELVHA